MLRTIFFIMVALASFLTASSQKILTLQQCIDTALAANIGVRQSALTSEVADVNLKQARMNLLPSLNAEINHGMNNGRSIDPFTNTYVNQNVNTASYGLSSGVVVFRGFTLQNQIRQNATAYEASRMEWQQTKDNLVLNVILAYLAALGDDDAIALAQSQADYSKSALDRLNVLNSQGAVKPSDVSDLKGQYMNDQLNLLDARARRESSYLELAKLMNRPYDPGMRLQRIDAEEFIASYPFTAAELYNKALGLPMVRAVELRTQSARYQLKASKGLYFPQVSLGANFNTTYSSVAQNSGGKIPYSSQLKNNRFSSIGVGVSIPIFNGSLTRNRVRLADINVRNTALLEEQLKIRLWQDIDQAWLNMNNALERYRLLLDQEKAYEASFTAAEIRFNAGVGSTVDYLTAKDRLDRSRINLLNAKYDFVLRKRILDYYGGK